LIDGRSTDSEASTWEGKITHRHPTSDRLRHDISRGRAGDKVDFPDPAAAPLGTDDEAAGTPPSPESIQLAYDLEIGRPVSSAREEQRDYGVAIFALIIVGLLIGLGAGFLVL
jgi:hypothetical protein